MPTPDEIAARKQLQDEGYSATYAPASIQPLADPLGSEADARQQLAAEGYPIAVKPSITKQPPVPTGFGPFLKSTLSAAGPELFGMEPVDSTRRYRDENFGAGLASQMIGYAAPMLAGAGIARAFKVPELLAKVPVLGRGMTAAKAIEKEHPAFARGIEEVYALLPYEGARIAGSQIAEAKGHEGAGSRTLGEVGLDLGAGLVLGAGLDVLRQARPFVSRSKYRTGAGRGRQIGTLTEEIENYLPEDIPQARFKVLDEAPPTKATGKRAELYEYDRQGELVRAEQEILHQRPGTRERRDWRAKIETTSDTQPIIKEELSHIRPLEGGTRDGNWKRLSDLFKPHRVKGKFSTKMLVTGKEGFKTAEEVLDARAWLDAHPGWQSRVQFPRIVETVSDDGLSVVSDTLRKSLGTEIEPGFFMRREAGGLFVVAKKIETEAAGKSRYVLFKTHEPGHFFPNLQQATDIVDRNSYLIRSHTARDGDRAASRTYQQWDDGIKRYPPPGPETPLPPRQHSVTRKLFEGLLPKEVEALRRDMADTLANFGRVAKEYLAPLSHKFSKSARFTWLTDMAKTSYEMASFRALTRFFGERLPMKSKNLLGGLFEVPRFTGGVRQILRDVHETGPEAWRQFNVARVLTMSPEYAAEQGFHPNVVEALRKLDAVDKIGYEEIQRVHKYLGKGDEDFTPLMYHRMMSMQWRGSFRARIVDKNGHTLGFGAGKLPGQAQKEADTIIRHLDDVLKAEGKEPSGAKVVEMFNSSFDRDAKIVAELGGTENSLYESFRQARTRAYMPQRFKERGGMRGFTGDIGSGLEPLTLKEAENYTLGNMIETELHATHQVVSREAEKYIRDFSAIDGDAMGAQMRKTLESMQGVRGKFSQAVSEGVDKFLAPLIGANAAERIVRTLNRTQYGLTLGFADIGYPLVNMTSILTQMLPEVAFVTRALPESLARAYNFHAVPLTNGGLADIGVFHPVKFLWQTLKELRNPDDELRSVFNRALADGKIAPRFLEEFAGKDSELALRLGEALKGKESLVEVLKALNEFPGAKSEELARAVAFAGGYRLFRSHVGLEPELAYKAASHFVTRSMYGYSASERPLVLTGPLGTAFGLFKNYSFNYVANMMQFAAEGAARGNWAPLLWMVGTTGAVAGVGGTPLYLVAKGVNSVFSDKDLTENLYSLAGPDREHRDPFVAAFADVIHDGFPSLAGISLRGRAMSPGSNPIQDLSMMTSIMLLDRMKYLGVGVQKGMDHYAATGQHPINSKEMRDAFTIAFAPRTVQRYNALTEDRAIRSLKTHNKLIEPQSELMSALMVLGIQPLAVAKAYELDNLQRGYVERRAADVHAFGTAYAQARMNNDFLGMRHVLSRGMENGVPTESIIRSATVIVHNQGATREERTGRTLEARARALLFK